MLQGTSTFGVPSSKFFVVKVKLKCAPDTGESETTNPTETEQNCGRARKHDKDTVSLTFSSMVQFCRVG